MCASSAGSRRCRRVISLPPAGLASLCAVAIQVAAASPPARSAQVRREGSASLGDHFNAEALAPRSVAQGSGGVRWRWRAADVSTKAAESAGAPVVPMEIWQDCCCCVKDSLLVTQKAYLDAEGMPHCIPASDRSDGASLKQEEIDYLCLAYAWSCPRSTGALPSDDTYTRSKLCLHEGPHTASNASQQMNHSHLTNHSVHYNYSGINLTGETVALRFSISSMDYTKMESFSMVNMVATLADAIQSANVGVPASHVVVTAGPGMSFLVKIYAPMGTDVATIQEAVESSLTLKNGIISNLNALPNITRISNETMLTVSSFSDWSVGIKAARAEEKAKSSSPPLAAPLLALFVLLLAANNNCIEV